MYVSPREFLAELEIWTQVLGVAMNTENGAFLSEISVRYV